MKRRNDNYDSVPDTGNSNMVVFTPKDFDDVENAITMLKDNKTLLVYLNRLQPSDAQRVLDLLSGAVFALDGDLFEVDKDIFMLTPCSVNLISND